MPDNVLVREWFPQNSILAHNKTVLYFGHGGLNGLNEAIKYRKPMLSMPIWSDGWDTTNRSVRNLHLNVILEDSESQLEKLQKISKF